MKLRMLAAATGIAALATFTGAPAANAIGLAASGPDMQGTNLWYSLAANNKCVGLANGGSTANGTELVVWDCHGHLDQRWTNFQSGSGWAIASLAADNKCVGLADGGSTANGTRLVLWNCHGHRDQQWHSITGDDLIYSNAADNKCIGLADGGSTANGTRLVLWNCHGHRDQQWRIDY
ncbi:RICIN domain-containing protein [Streptomyces olivoreticuli]|uniref:Ricin B lectin domain-containing protein n=2 Tax=Streptomyces blastmyceticus TaxID=68180 RepID=A0ABN0WV93_9ACTN